MSSFNPGPSSQQTQNLQSIYGTQVSLAQLANPTPDLLANINTTYETPDGRLWQSNGSALFQLLAGGQTVLPGNLTTQVATLPGANTIEVGNTTTANLVVPGNVSSEVAIAKVNQVQFFGGGNLVSPAHMVGSFNYSFIDATGQSVAMAIGAECSLGMGHGTLARGNSALLTINGMSNASVMTLWTGATASPTNVSSGCTITRSEGYRHEILSTTMLGTIGTSVGYYVADSSPVTGAASRFGFVNDDAGARNTAKSPWIDNSFQAFTPTNGGTTNIPAGVGLVVLNSGGTIVSTTIALPTVITDGQVITFFNVAQITSVSYTSGGITPLGLPSQLLAAGFFSIQYIAAGPYYVRVG